MAPLTKADTRTPSSAPTQPGGGVALGVGNGAAVAEDTVVAVGSELGAVLKLPPVWIVKLVGSGVDKTLRTSCVAVGEGMGVALNKAWTVAWPR